ncbi:hypothetical protein GCM10008915_23380 [Bifidobacterium pullorum subsp. gallinarum]
MIAHRRYHPIPKWKFEYDAERNVHIYPAGQELQYVTTDRKGYRQYASDPAQCEQCPLRHQCTQAKNHRKVVTQHVWEDSKEWVRNNRLSRSGKQLYRKRKETIERSFADAKELHGFATAGCAVCRTSGNKP